MQLSFYFIMYVIGKHVRQLQARSIELGRHSITRNLVKIISNKFHILYWSYYIAKITRHRI